MSLTATIATEESSALIPLEETPLAAAAVDVEVEVGTGSMLEQFAAVADVPASAMKSAAAAPFPAVRNAVIAPLGSVKGNQNRLKSMLHRPTASSTRSLRRPLRLHPSRPPPRRATAARTRRVEDRPC